MGPLHGEGALISSKPRDILVCVVNWAELRPWKYPYNFRNATLIRPGWAAHGAQKLPY